MKRISFSVLIVLGLLTTSCDIYNDEPVYIQVSPVTEVTNPEKFAKDSITEIPVNFNLPSKCNVFRGFYYDTADFQRVVAIESYREGNQSCPTDDNTYTQTLRFKPTKLGIYHFKFWTGNDAQGVEQFYEFDAIVDH
ncbi:hypothetical protein [Flavobacterium stagni]|uniref:Uncharacterized protein n=1 Tax=Flavobacterium stagni TaxID=2506421 RepID=A0A4V1N313_9FLAO|nr:hypothetical protein [Flavobacterium stagni]RXR24400.1 hypothetical protein EQG61_02850 [Flavobacterium stagni]